MLYYTVLGKENAGASTINQRLVFVGREDGKLLAMRQLIQSGKYRRFYYQLRNCHHQHQQSS